MRIGIMQPYFFPNLAHFALISVVDSWVIFDVSQYTRKSWMCRNRILDPKHGWQYINVTVEKAPLETKTKDIKVRDAMQTKRDLLAKLKHYENSAPFYWEVVTLVKETVPESSEVSLVDLNEAGLSSVCTYLGMEFSPKRCSTLAIEYPKRMQPGDWAPMVAAHLGADCYINPISGKPLFDPTDFERFDIKLKFADMADITYATAHYTYQPMLSILDVLMWNSPKQTRALMKNVSIEGV